MINYIFWTSLVSWSLVDVTSGGKLPLLWDIEDSNVVFLQGIRITKWSHNVLYILDNSLQGFRWPSTMQMSDMGALHILSDLIECSSVWHHTLKAAFYKGLPKFLTNTVLPKWHGIASKCVLSQTLLAYIRKQGRRYVASTVGELTSDSHCPGLGYFAFQIKEKTSNITEIQQLKGTNNFPTSEVKPRKVENQLPQQEVEGITLIKLITYRTKHLVQVCINHCDVLILMCA